MNSLRKTLRFTAAIAALSLSACIPAATEPTPAPRPTPTPAVSAPPVQTTARPVSQLADNWADLPRTAGDWTYGPAVDGSAARFVDNNGRTLLAVSCSRSTRRVLIGRMATNLPDRPTMDIRTETAQRSSVLERVDNSGNASSPNVVWAFEANDRFLEAIGFSRGHFAVGVTGAEAIYPPAYPEITRVIEDCR